MNSAMRYFSILFLLAGFGLAGAQGQTTSQEIVVNVQLTSSAQNLSVSRSVKGGNFYPYDGGIIEITIVFSGSVGGSLGSLSLVETIPAEWTYNSFVGDSSVFVTQPAPGQRGALPFVWSTPPATLPASITYRLNVPAGGSDEKQISGSGAYNTGKSSDSGFGPVVTMLSTCAAPSVPTGVTASDGSSSTEIYLSWNAVPGAIEYEIYRNTSDNSNGAIHIATVTNPFYTDTVAAARSDANVGIPGPIPNNRTELPGPPVHLAVSLFAALAALTIAEALRNGRLPQLRQLGRHAAYGVLFVAMLFSLGCPSGGGGTSPTMYYYWVKAVSACDLKSDFSGGDSGFFKTDDNKDLAVYEQALPANDGQWDQRQVKAGDSIYMRLRTEAEVDVASVWARAMVGDQPLVGAVYWLPIEGAGGTDGWIAFEPALPLQEGDRITMFAGGNTVNGDSHSLLSEDFEVIGEPLEADPVLEQPEYIEATNESDTEPAPELASVTELNVQPRYAGDPSIAYEVGPHEPYTTPRRVWLPVPDGYYPDDMMLLYRLEHEDGSISWYPADAVTGAVVPDSYLYLDTGTNYWFGFLMRHGGTVSLVGPDQ